MCQRGSGQLDMLNLVYQSTQDEIVYQALSRRMKDKFDMGGFRRMDRSKNPKRALAAGTFQDIDFERAPHQLGPGVITEAWGWQRRPMRGLGGLGQGGNVSGRRGWRATAGMRVRFRSSGGG